jgi:hypothetical protein
VFFKRENQGEYRLYSPLNDGPQSLMVHYSGDMTAIRAFGRSGIEPPSPGSRCRSSRGVVYDEPLDPSEILLNKQIPASSYGGSRTTTRTSSCATRTSSTSIHSQLHRHDNLINVTPTLGRLCPLPHRALALTLKSRSRVPGRPGGQRDGLGRRGTMVYQFDRAVHPPGPRPVREDQGTFQLPDLFPWPRGGTPEHPLEEPADQGLHLLEADLLVPDRPRSG